MDTQEMGWEIASLRGENEQLKYDIENLTAHANDLRVELNRLTNEHEQLVAQTETLRSSMRLEGAVKAELDACRTDNECLRGMVCSRSNECIDFCSLLDTVEERYNADD